MNDPKEFFLFATCVFYFLGFYALWERQVILWSYKRLDREAFEKNYKENFDKWGFRFLTSCAGVVISLFGFLIS